MLFFENMKLPYLLYHGTCNAFILHAKQNNNNFGPEKGIGLTSNFNSAIKYAGRWEIPEGKKVLEEQIEIEQFTNDLLEPFVLEFNTIKLPEEIVPDPKDPNEFCLVPGPINLNLITARCARQLESLIGWVYK